MAMDINDVIKDSYFATPEGQKLVKLMTYRNMLFEVAANEGMSTFDIGAILQVMLLMYLYIDIMEDVCKADTKVTHFLRDKLNESFKNLGFMKGDNGPEGDKKGKLF